MVSADLSNKGELIGVETRHKCVPLQLLTPSFGYGGLCECRHAQAPDAHRHLTHTNMHHPHPPITQTCT